MQDIVITLLQKMFILTLQMSVPILLVGVIIGLMVSIFQTVTQIQESTLTFVPKILGGIIIMIILMDGCVKKVINNIQTLLKLKLVWQFGI